jgi:hypothetical protein
MTLTTGTTETNPSTETTPAGEPETGPAPARRSSLRVTMAWAAVVLACLVTAILAVVALAPGDSSTSTGRTPVPSGALAGVPASPDAAERWLLSEDEASIRPAGVPASPDAAERWLLSEDEASGRPAGVPASPDAAERWLLSEDEASIRPAGVPASPDAAERWLLGDESR